ncbi:MAG: hypothetical protein HOC71_05505 [Candidatus Latescibacteria bacterium]|jgi:hypothetical protein|nr:hypothetical protein [Candidatus Latescibacterota bacterium]
MKFYSPALICVLIIFIVPLNSYGQSQDSYIIKYQINKPYCLLNFMETLKTNGYYGPTLHTFYKKSKFSENEVLANLVKQYQRLNIGYSYEFNGYPKYRFMAKGKSTRDLFYTLSAKAETLAEFKQITVGIIPFYKHQQLFEIFEAVEPMYDELIWDQYYDVAQKRLRELEEYSQQVNLEEKLNNYENFFNSSWPTDIPIILTFSVVPGDKVRLVPPPQGNVVFCGLVTESDDYAWYAALLTHEFSHRAFAEKSLESHQQIDQWFSDSKSPDRFMVNFMFNEVLGGAIGHKMKDNLIGPHDFSYGQSFIRDFDEAIYPLVVSYLDEGKTLDENFIEQSLHIYGETFPNAYKEYNYLLQTYYLLTDVEDYPIPRLIRKNISSPLMYESEKPIMDDSKIDKLINYDFTKLIVISKDHERTFKYLQNKIPELNEYNILTTESDFVLSFLGGDGKAYIIVNLHSMEKFIEVLEVLKVQKIIDSNNPFLSIG